MKKIFYSFVILSLMLSSCNPMEDIYSEIDAVESIVSGEATITLTDDDYTNDLDDGGLGLNFPNFSSEDDAKSMLPAFLSSKYPAWGKESLAEVTFKLYAPKSTESSLEIYEVTDADYVAGGHTYGNFSSSSDITDFLDTKYPDASNRLLVSLTYKYYSGSVATLNNGFLYVDGSWEMIDGFTDEEYETMGESYPNFSSEAEALSKIPVFLLEKFKFDGKVAGDIAQIMYKLYVGGGVTESYVANFVFDGTSWDEYSNVLEETIKFGHDGDSWVPDNTIKYTLTAADYAIVGNDRYGNFDVRSGKDEEDEAVRVEKISTILLNNFPNDAEGQKYIVSYNIYNGANGVWSLAVIKEGSAYVKQ